MTFECWTWKSVDPFPARSCNIPIKTYQTLTQKKKKTMKSDLSRDRKWKMIKFSRLLFDFWKIATVSNRLHSAVLVFVKVNTAFYDRDRYGKRAIFSRKQNVWGKTYFSLSIDGDWFLRGKSNIICCHESFLQILNVERNHLPRWVQ